MANGDDQLPLNSNRLRALFGLSPLNVPTSQPTQSDQSQPSNITLNIPPPDPRVTSQAMQDLSGLRQYTESYPNVQAYKPGRTRRILGDVAGTLYGLGTANPRAGVQLASSIKDFPLNEQIRRYNQGAVPYEQRAKLGLTEAQLAGMSAENLYKYILGNTSLERAKVAERNAETNRLKATAPTPFGSQVTTMQPGTTPATTTQYGKIFNPDTGQFEIKPITQGQSTAETFGQRQALQQGQQQGQQTLQAQKDAAAWKRAQLSYMAHMASIGASSSRQAVGLISKIWENIPPSYIKEVYMNASKSHPELFQNVVTKDAQGNITGSTLVPKQNMTPKEQQEFTTSINDETKNILTLHNDPLSQALKSIGTKKNPLVVGEEDATE